MTTHRHTPEIEEQLSYASGEPVMINFTPHLVPMNRGILATEYASLKEKVKMCIRDRCGVIASDQVAQILKIKNRNFVHIYFLL